MEPVGVVNLQFNKDYFRFYRFFNSHMIGLQDCQLKKLDEPYYDENEAFSFITNPVNYKMVEVELLVGKQDLNNLVNLIPEVTYLCLAFKENHTKYDLLPLLKLSKENGGKLSHLLIYSKGFSRTYPIRLKHVDSLIGKFEVLNICGKEITQGPYEYPYIRNKKFRNINHINNVNSIKIFNLRTSKASIELLEDIDKEVRHCKYGENIILQYIDMGDRKTYLCFVPKACVRGLDNKEEVGCAVFNLSKDQFDKIIFSEIQQEDYPENDDLYSEDNDDVPE